MGRDKSGCNAGWAYFGILAKIKCEWIEVKEDEEEYKKPKMSALRAAVIGQPLLKTANIEEEKLLKEQNRAFQWKTLQRKAQF